MGEAVTSRHAQPPLAWSTLPAEQASESSAELSEDDPFTAYLLAAAGPVDIRRLNLESPALKTLKEAGAVLVVPMISAGVPVSKAMPYPGVSAVPVTESFQPSRSVPGRPMGNQPT